MITDTQNEVDQNPDSFLSQGLREISGVDVSGYASNESDDNTTLKTDMQDRGTADPELNQEASQETSNKSNTDTSTAKNNDAQPQGKGRSNERIQELLAQVKERDAKIAEYEKNKNSQAPQPLDKPINLDAQKAQETPVMIPKPEFDVKTLEGLEKKYDDALDEHMVNGDIAKIRETKLILRDIRTKLEEAKTWESRNKAELDKYNSHLSHYRNQIVEKWPEMKDEKSPIRQEYAKIHSRFLELQKNPALLEYELASLASLGLNAAKASVLEEQNKKLQQEIALLKDKQKPLSQTESASAGRSNEKDDPDEFLRHGLRHLNIRTTR